MLFLLVLSWKFKNEYLVDTIDTVSVLCLSHTFFSNNNNDGQWTVTRSWSTLINVPTRKITC